MTAEYELTKDDLRAFNLYHHGHSPASRRHYLLAWWVPAVIWFLVCAGIWYFAGREGRTPLRAFLDLLPLFCGVPLYLLCFPWAYRRKLRKMVDAMAGEGENRGLFSHHRVTISPESVTDSCEHGQTSSTWRGVERVVAADEHAYIYINALAALIVPRRAFADPAEFEEFVRTARGYHEKAVG
jgi:YcxB-like protein